ncbi:MAG: rhamnulose-1-phosphate aldolase [Clostridia bacterium]|nr:rhamnulose-1-phosphate aldolase [Clostridia bacterium]
MKNIFEAPFVREMERTTANMYRLGWDERNGGNISYMLDEALVGKYLDFNTVLRRIPTGFDAKELAGKIFIVTGTGKYFKNVDDDPETNLGIIRISENGLDAELLWGYKDGGRFTSELPSHLMSHIARLKADPKNRIIMHCHPDYTLAMTQVHEMEEKAVTRTLWGQMTESIVVFPDGVGVLPWMVCGTNEIGRATAEKMKDFRLVIWTLHGIYGAGRSMDEVFGLIETVEKAAKQYMLTLPYDKKQCISDEELVALAEQFGLTYRKDFLDLPQA